MHSRVALSAKHTRFTLTHGGVYRIAHTLTSLAVTFDDRWRRAVAFGCEGEGGCWKSSDAWRQLIWFSRGAVSSWSLMPRHLGGEKNACTDSTLIRFEGVFVSLTESGGDDATAVQRDGARSLCSWWRRVLNPTVLWRCQVSLCVSTYV